MAFKPGVSGNPAGRPKKLLRRVDEVLHERKIEPLSEILRILEALRRRAKKAKAADKPALEQQQLKIWLELLPYIHPRVREQPLDELPAPTALGRPDVSNEELLRLVKKPTEQKAGA